MAFAWVAFPYTDFVLQSNSNDSLVAALLIWSLVAFSSLAGRALLLALATAAKFTPLVLAPLYAAGEQGLAGRLSWSRLGRPMRLRLAYFTTVFVATIALLLAYPAIEPGLATFWDRTLSTQIGRTSPFSIWGQETALQPLQTLLTVAMAVLAASLALIPRERSLVQIAALSAAVMIGVQITLDHWFYAYIPWFLGLLLAAIAPRPEGWLRARFDRRVPFDREDPVAMNPAAPATGRPGARSR